MSAEQLAMLALGLAALLGSSYTLRSARPHRILRIALQLATALLLYFCLFPPPTREDFAAGDLVVLTPGATPAQMEALPSATAVVALPGAMDHGGVETVPDLGTALRRHPDSRRLHLVGNGLPSRDRDAARGRVATFDAAPLPRGLVELDTPAWVRAGSAWRVAGRAEAVANGRVELRDPAGALVTASALDAQGRFALNALAKGEGETLFMLKLLDKDGVRVEETAIPLVARAGESLKLLLLAGAPDPELKYLRRWAADAGLALDSRVALSDGVALTEGAAALDTDALRAADVAIIDERAWASLDASRKMAVVAAVRDGLGLLLRVTGPIAAAVAEDWAALGLRTRAADATPIISLDKVLGLGDSGLSFTQRALAVDAADAAPLLRSDDGSPLALWRNDGQGRVALWWLADSYRLVLGGERARFGSLWSEVLTTLARARGEAAPDLPRAARVDERALLCGITPDAAVEIEQGTRIGLIVERETTQHGCAAYWPAQPGWHRLISAGQRWPFYVRAGGEASALAAAENAEATRALIGAPGADAAIATRASPRSRWPFFLAWLALAALLWWFERAAARTVAITQ